jgi:hypothetical protein
LLVELILDQTPEIVKYYKDNWQTIKPMWVSHYRRQIVTNGSDTNNISESLNRVLKGFIDKQTKMSRCLRKLLNFLDDQMVGISFDEFKEK